MGPVSQYNYPKNEEKHEMVSQIGQVNSVSHSNILTYTSKPYYKYEPTLLSIFIQNLSYLQTYTHKKPKRKPQSNGFLTSFNSPIIFIFFFFLFKENQCCYSCPKPSKTQFLSSKNINEKATG